MAVLINNSQFALYIYGGEEVVVVVGGGVTETESSFGAVSIAAQQTSMRALPSIGVSAPCLIATEVEL